MGIAEGRINSLKEIEEKSKKIKELEDAADENRVLSIVRTLNDEERASYNEQLKEIAKLRGDVLSSLQVLLSCQTVGGLEEGGALSVVIESMQDELLNFENKIEEVEDEIYKTYECIKLLKDVNHTGYKYLCDKIDALYSQNTEIWNQTAPLSKNILSLDAEINAIKTKAKETSCEDSEPNA